jgi:hypothetical protein
MSDGGCFDFHTIINRFTPKTSLKPVCASLQDIYIVCVSFMFFRAFKIGLCEKKLDGTVVGC